MTTQNLFHYRVRNIEAVDGDTVNADIDVGFNTFVHLPVRLLGINAAEHGTPGGDAATTHLAVLLSVRVTDWIEIVTVKDATDKYGRFLGHLRIFDQHGNQRTDINASMVLDGYASLYGGTGPKPIPPFPAVPVPGPVTITP